jgi:hypothetical protein
MILKRRKMLKRRKARSRRRRSRKARRKRLVILRQVPPENPRQHLSEFATYQVDSE